MLSSFHSPFLLQMRTSGPREGNRLSQHTAGTKGSEERFLLQSLQSPTLSGSG